MRKPSWMNREQWADFNRINPIFVCRCCGETDVSLATVDHVIPKWQGGLDELSNYQWLCASCNSRKGPRDDPYWSQNFYFDRPLNLSALRESQRQEVHEKILHYCDWFTRPFSQISGYLLVLAWAVGSGKTLAAPVIAFTLNHVIRRDCGSAAPRVNRMLILCKEESNRKQIAVDLKRDIVRHEFCQMAPRVLEITDGKMLDSPQHLESFDIIVCCIQMFFEKNGQPRKNLEYTLAQFPLIVFDEPHFAHNQVASIVRSASISLCFGLTGSPIDADGDILQSYVLFSLYDYQSACDNDQCMKLLVDPISPKWNEIFEEVDITEAKMHGGGKDFTTHTTRVEGYPLNARPAIAVAANVVRYVYDCDHMFSGNPLFDDPSRVAIHRPPTAIADLAYPIHAMIEAENIEMGYILHQFLEDLFRSDRNRYPLKLGYRSAIVHSSVDGDSGNSRRAKKLGTDHGWMLVKENGGCLHPDSVRFLVVIDIGREGVHNPFCGLVGVACPSYSEVNGVQRILGRQLRAFTTEDDEGRLHVPPDVLDTVKIITHSAYMNSSTIISAVQFILNMSDRLDGMLSMDQLVDGSISDANPSTIELSTLLSIPEKLAIIDVVGTQRLEGATRINIDHVVKRIGGDSEVKRSRANGFGSIVISDPPLTRRIMGLSNDLREIPRVLREHPVVAPSDEELIRFVKQQHSSLVRYCIDLDKSGYREIFREFYSDHVSRFHLPELAIQTKLSDIRKHIGAIAKSKYGKYYNGPDQKFYALAGSAIKIVLGIQNCEKGDDHGKYDIPECHVILNRPDVRRDIIGWIIRNLISDGQCPTLAAGLGIIPEGEDSADVA